MARRSRKQPEKDWSVIRFCDLFRAVAEDTWFLKYSHWACGTMDGYLGGNMELDHLMTVLVEHAEEGPRGGSCGPGSNVASYERTFWLADGRVELLSGNYLWAPKGLYVHGRSTATELARLMGIRKPRFLIDRKFPAPAQQVLEVRPPHADLDTLNELAATEDLILAPWMVLPDSAKRAQLVADMQVEARSRSCEMESGEALMQRLWHWALVSPRHHGGDEDDHVSWTYLRWLLKDRAATAYAGLRDRRGDARRLMVLAALNRAARMPRTNGARANTAIGSHRWRWLQDELAKGGFYPDGLWPAPRHEPVDPRTLWRRPPGRH
jgi:hypothetical protein